MDRSQLSMAHSSLSSSKREAPLMTPDHGSVPASVWSNPNPGIVPATEYYDDARDDYQAQDNRPEGDQDNNGGDYSDHLQDVHVQPD